MAANLAETFSQTLRTPGSELSQEYENASEGLCSTLKKALDDLSLEYGRVSETLDSQKRYLAEREKLCEERARQLEIEEEEIRADLERKYQEKIMQLEKREEDFEKRIAEVLRLNCSNEILNLNVGGQEITALRKTLTQRKGSLLELLFNGEAFESLPRTSSGSIFIDYDPVCFGILMEWLHVYDLDPDGFAVPTVAEDLLYKFVPFVEHLKLEDVFNTNLSEFKILEGDVDTRQKFRFLSDKPAVVASRKPLGNKTSYHAFSIDRLRMDDGQAEIFVGIMEGRDLEGREKIGASYRCFGNDGFGVQTGDVILMKVDQNNNTLYLAVKGRQAPPTKLFFDTCESHPWYLCLSANRSGIIVSYFNVPQEPHELQEGASEQALSPSEWVQLESEGLDDWEPEIRRAPFRCPDFNAFTAPYGDVELSNNTIRHTGPSGWCPVLSEPFEGDVCYWKFIMDALPNNNSVMLGVLGSDKVHRWSPHADINSYCWYAPGFIWTQGRCRANVDGFDGFKQGDSLYFKFDRLKSRIEMAISGDLRRSFTLSLSGASSAPWRIHVLTLCASTKITYIPLKKIPEVFLH